MKGLKVLDVTPKGWGRELIASYLIASEKVALIDIGPGSSSDQLIGILRDLKVEPDYLIVTHVHLDHAGSAGHLVREYPEAKVVVHPKGAPHLVDPSRLWEAAQGVLGVVARIYGEPLRVPTGNISVLEDGSTLDLGGGFSLSVHYTPGHASHHQSILLKPEGILFTGDSAGISIVVDGRRVELPTTPPPFHLASYIQSLEKMKLLKPRKAAPTHYGVKEEDGTSYLERERERSIRWYNAVKRLYSEGIVDVDEASRLLAEEDGDARVSYSHPNPIVREVFYRGTVWGLLEAVKNEIKNN